MRRRLMPQRSWESKTTPPKYPYNGTWFSDFLAFAAEHLAHRGKPNAYNKWLRGVQTPVDTSTVTTEEDKALRLSAEHGQYEEEWVTSMHALVDAADIWDVWTLVRMLQCISTPLKYDIHLPQVRLADENIIRELLCSVGLQHSSDLELVCLRGTKRTLPFPDHSHDQNHYRHAPYLTEDVNTCYLAANFDFPGLVVSCKCVECSFTGQQGRHVDEAERSGEQKGNEISRIHQNDHCQYHRGEVVFVRWKLENTSFVQNVDRFWMDWNDCMLVVGSGVDDDNKLIDRDTVYLLQTLPGLKARALKALAVDEARGLASACLFFNLKLDNRDILETNRQTLRDIMGPHYLPHICDFTYAIDHGDFDFSSVELLFRGGYGSTFLVPWKKARWYNHRIKNTIQFYGYTSVPVRFCRYTRGSRKASMISPWFGGTPQSSCEETVWGFVFDHAVHGPLLDRIEVLVEGASEEETWLTLLTFLLEIGTAIRDMHKVVGPYRSISPNTILLRSRRSEARGSDFNLKGLDDVADANLVPRAALYEAILFEPGDVPSTKDIAPEIEVLGRNHSPATDAYAFACYALFVYYLEILAALEAILDGSPEKDDRSGGEEEDNNNGKGKEAQPSSPAGGSASGPIPSYDASYLFRSLPRVKAMDEFLKIARMVVSRKVSLRDRHPVPETSVWHDIEEVFPHLKRRLHLCGTQFAKQNVALYSILEPCDWTWNDHNQPGSGSSDGNDDSGDGGDGDDGIVWEDSGSDSLGSGFFSGSESDGGAGGPP
ncbi:hypothetical protein C8A03DRAFT_34690 [Achaetomium macrosporum]|uniref:Protein kinase domain-containing protein n=1 Tax=Achaetomium macrosporum TaxID=79813 RepID=A0AAN7C8R3_9PEZI|nr:hypothetical protein C8A03DRAFT_34690 [Achaetomium macrosporum]